MTTPTLPPEIEAAIADAGQALVDAWDSAQDGPPHRFVVFVDPEGDPEVAAGWMAMARMHAAAIAAAREAGRREVLEGAAGVETSLLKLAAVAYSQGTHAVRARIGEDGADRDHLRASGDLIVAEQSHRAAIAADKARAVEAASDAAFDRGRAATIKYADGLVMRPVLSREDAERLVGDFNASPYDGSDDCPARAALLAALTGAGGGE